MEDNTLQQTASSDEPTAESAPMAEPLKLAEPSSKGGLLKQLPYLAIFAALLLLLSLTGVRRKSATFDEGAHLPAGFSYLAYRDYRMNMEHPPLIKLLAGVPLLAMSAKVDTSHAAWKTGDQFHFGEEFLYAWNDADRMLFWGRFADSAAFRAVRRGGVLLRPRMVRRESRLRGLCCFISARRICRRTDNW